MGLVYERVVGVRQFDYKSKKTGSAEHAAVISLALPNIVRPGNWGSQVHEYFIDSRSNVYPVVISLKEGDEVYPAERNGFVQELILKESSKK